MNDKITLKNFGASNRTRRIGNSVYRICKTITGKWYIYENYDDGYEINRGTVTTAKTSPPLLTA